MPTGYTAGIVDGKIKTFPEFAKLCMRAFGATIHMRDDSMTAEYQPRVPTRYYSEQLEVYGKKLADAKSFSDEGVIDARKEELEKTKAYHEERIIEVNKNKDVLERFLNDVQKYTPPTAEHEGVKKFMEEQITETIKYDGSATYHEEALQKINEELADLNPKKIRAQMIADAERNVAYHEKQQAEELKRCTDSNKWVDDFLKSINIKP